MRTVALLLALVPVFAFATPANAADAVTVQADLDGDGRSDKVVVKPVADNEYEQLLVATVHGVRLTARLPLYSYEGVQPLQVVDLDGDGRDEVVVTESVGANTLGFSVWGLFGGLRPVTTPDGSVLKLWEGGSVTTLTGYGCETADDSRLLVTVGGWLNDEATLYTGERVTYSVAGSVATETSRVPVVGPRNAEGFQVAPEACA